VLIHFLSKCIFLEEVDFLETVYLFGGSVFLQRSVCLEEVYFLEEHGTHGVPYNRPMCLLQLKGGAAGYKQKNNIIVTLVISCTISEIFALTSASQMDG